MNEERILSMRKIAVELSKDFEAIHKEHPSKYAMNRAWHHLGDALETSSMKWKDVRKIPTPTPGIEHYLRVLRDNKLTAHQAELLLALDREEETVMKDLARILKCSTANITMVVDVMESRGFIRREYCKKDRRMILPILTAAGSQLVRQLRR